MLNKEKLFVTLLVGCLVTFCVGLVLIVSAQPVSAGQVAEAPLVSQRIQLVEEKGFNRANVTIVRVTYNERFSDVTVEYCVAFSPNGSLVVLERRVVYDNK